MRSIIFTLALFFVTSLTTAQSKILDGLTTFKLKNSGTLMDKNDNVDGYYFFYEVDKLKKGKREYAIKFLDNNLNEVATKSHIDGKKTYLFDVQFNNQALMVTLVDPKEDQFTLLTFDRQGNKLSTEKIPFESKMFKFMNMQRNSGQFKILIPADDKGFLFSELVDNKKYGYKIHYYPTDGGKKWVYASDPKAKYILGMNILDVNDKMIIAQESSRKALLNSKGNNSIVAIDINTGKELWRKVYEKEVEPRFIKNAIITPENNVVALGEYYPKGKNWYSTESTGLFAHTFSSDGTNMSDQKLLWKQDLKAKMPANAKFEKKNEYVFFHDFIRMNDGTYYAIGEKFKKNLNAAGMLLGGSKTKLVITDALIFKFTPEFVLDDVEVLKKGKSRVASLADFGSPQLNALALSAYGAFDHNYTQKNLDRDQFVASFTDYERLKGEKNKYAFTALSLEDGEFTSDKIYLENSTKNKSYRILPAKTGNVTIIEYDKKEKTTSIRLEKLNL